MRDSKVFHAMSAVSLIAVFLFVRPSPSLATSFTFNSYTGVIGESYIIQGTGRTGAIYGTMNGYTFTEDDVDPSLGSAASSPLPGYDFQSLRGRRSFPAGTTRIDFGTSMLTFSAAENSQFGIGTSFLLGTFTFTNDGWHADTEPSALSFTISASSDVARLYNQEYTGTLLMYTNPNSLETHEERADWFYIQENPELGSIRVFEIDDGENTGSVELWGAFGSLDLVEFRNPTGGAFLSASTGSNPSTPVPEPGTVLLLGCGLAGLAACRKKLKSLSTPRHE